jgi:hypothetical protein
MADGHKRVEPRNIVGTGMATDAERVQSLEDEVARRERAWRNAPERGFGEVLSETPGKEQELADVPGLDEHEKKRRAALAAKRAAQQLPRVPVDPRERALRAMPLLREQTKPGVEKKPTSQTPPTGNMTNPRRKP